MKTKKMLLIVIIAAVLAMGWILAIRSASGAETLKEQKELITEADSLLERRIYVRAIALYEQALNMDTKRTVDIQEKLLQAYSGYEDMDSYVTLVEKRDAAGTAKEEEYLEAAKYWAAKSKWEEAVTILKKGIQKTDSQAMKDYMEEIRYPYTVRTTKYQEILPSADNQYMPAFDGTKWGYISPDGMNELSFIYDSATVFGSKGYAVVSQNGTYYTILKNGDWYGVNDGVAYDKKLEDVVGVSGSRILGKTEAGYSYFDYDFVPLSEKFLFDQISGNACGVAAVAKNGKWGIITNSGETVVDYVLEDVAINSLGNAFAGNHAMVKENGSWHLIDTEGNRIGEENYADAKAPESDEYIAIADATGKWGYIDQEGNQVIPCQYVDAKSFSNHVGAVLSVTNWGYISEKNEVVIEQQYQSAQPFHKGVAQAGLLDGVALIQLKYYEE